MLVHAMSFEGDGNACQILVVLDGLPPPIKRDEIHRRRDKRQTLVQQRDAPVEPTRVEEAALTKRLRAFHRAGAGKEYGHVVQALIVALRSMELPFMVAPYEADGQLAYLSEQGLVDLVVTEDSDLIACGASPILFKIMMPKKKKKKKKNTHDKDDDDDDEDPYDDDDGQFFRGRLVRQADLGATRDLDLLDFSPAMLAVLFVATGSDYCPSLPGIGIKTANAIVRDAFCRKPTTTTTTRRRLDGNSTVIHKPPLQIVLQRLFQQTRQDKATLTAEFRQAFEDRFLKAVVMFCHAVVFDPLAGCCRIRNEDRPDPDLMLYPPYAALVHSKARIQEICGRLPPPPLACHVAEGWIHLGTRRVRTTKGADGKEDTTCLPQSVQDYLTHQKTTTTRTTAEPNANDDHPEQDDAELFFQHPYDDDENDEDDDDPDERLETQQPEMVQLPIDVDPSPEKTPEWDTQPTTMEFATPRPATKRPPHSGGLSSPDPPGSMAHKQHEEEEEEEEESQPVEQLETQQGADPPSPSLLSRHDLASSPRDSSHTSPLLEAASATTQPPNKRIRTDSADPEEEEQLETQE